MWALPVAKEQIQQIISENNISRDREGEFEPQLIPKNQRDISGIEEKVISLYGL